MVDKVISSKGHGGNSAQTPGAERRGVRRDRFVVLVAFVLILCAVWAFQALRSGAGTPVVVSGPKVQIVTSELRGMTLNLHNNDKNTPYEQYVDEIAATGANTISFIVNAYQENGSSTTIQINARKVPPDARVLQLFARAKKKGLRVMLMPTVLLENPRDKEWRGLISPKNWGDWWEDYTNYIMHYARLAQAGGVDLFMVGTELNSTEEKTERWQALVARVRKEYKGHVSYSANWDHYHKVAWWGDLDAVGMTTYYDLTGGKEATVQRLLEAWKPIKKNLLGWQATVKKPIIFTEVGWPNQTTCAQYPWNYYGSETTDPQAQANCFEAFFRTWQDESNVAGIMVWEWRKRPGQETSPETDISYSPYGKPAMKHILEFYSRPYRKPPVSATQPTTTTSQPAEVSTKPE